MKMAGISLHGFILGSILAVASHGLMADEIAHDNYEDPLKLSNSLLLKDVLEKALARDPRHTLADEYQASADAYKNIAARPYSAAPAVDLHYQTDKLVSDQGLREWEANLEIPLWRWNQRQSLKDIGSSYEIYRSTYDEYLKLEVAGSIREIVWELAIANERKKLAKQAFDEALELEREVSSREKAGDLAPIDSLLAHDQALEKELEYVTQSMEYMHVAERYSSLTGLSEKPALISETIAKEDDSIDNHPLLKEIQAKIERAQSQINQIRRSQGEPVQLTFGARNEKGSAGDNDITSVGFGIRIPLDTAHFQQTSIVQAQNTLTELMIEKKQLEKMLHTKIHSEEHELETVRQQLEVVKQRQSAARENLRMARAAFRAGELDVGQLLRVASQTAAAELQFAIYQLEEKQAIARINQAMGVIP